MSGLTPFRVLWPPGLTQSSLLDVRPTLSAAYWSRRGLLGIKDGSTPYQTVQTTASATDRYSHLCRR